MPCTATIEPLPGRARKSLPVEFPLFTRLLQKTSFHNNATPNNHERIKNQPSPESRPITGYRPAALICAHLGAAASLESRLELPMSAEPKTVTTSVSACWLTARLPDLRKLARYRELPHSLTRSGIPLSPLLSANLDTVGPRSLRDVDGLAFG